MNIYKWISLSGLAVCAIVLSGCQNTNSGGPGGSETSLFGTPLPEGSEFGSQTGLPVDGDRSMFEHVYFSYDSSSVEPSETRKIEAVASYLNSNPSKGVILEGHCDERGSREYNLALGERRVLSVRDYLISLGVKSDAIQTKSYGEEAPLVMGHNNEAWAKNRCCVFAIYTK